MMHGQQNVNNNLTYIIIALMVQ